MNCTILDLFAKCSCHGGVICRFCTQLTIAFIAIIFGGLLVWKSKKIIDMQIVLYRIFNWKIEPISMKKEIWNTRIMGFAVLGLGIFSIGLVLLK